MPLFRLRPSVVLAVLGLSLAGVSASAAPNVKKGPEGQEITPDNNEKSFEEAKNKKVRFHMDFDKVDILEVVKAIAQWTKKNFILPDNVRGKITIIGPTDVTAQEAYNAFVAALETNNLSLVPTGTFYKILPKKDSIRGTIPTELDSSSGTLPMNEQMATKLFRLHYSEADPIKNVITQFITREGEVIAYPPDVLIVSDNSTNLARVEKFIKALDLPGSQDEINVVQCYHASAQELATELLQIFQPQGAQGGGQNRRPQFAPVPVAQPGGMGGPGIEGQGATAATVSKIIADERTNKLIVIASARAFLRINDLVKRLDVPTNSNQAHVYYLSNADAEEVATVLNSLSQGTQQRGRGGTNAAAAAAAPITAPPTGGGASFTGQIKVTADKSTNSLLIMASPSDYANLLSVIEQLDIRRRQVFIEAVIMEVKLSNENSHSVDFHTGYGFQNVTLPGTNSSTVPLVIGSEPTGAGTSLSLAGLASLSGFLAGVQGPPIQVTGLNITLPSFGVIVNALQKDSDVDVISTPHILTSDNNEAEISVGETVPFQTAVPAFGGLGGLAGLAGTTGAATTGIGGLGLGGLGLGLGGLAPIQRQPVELRLKIKPHVNESDFVKLEIDEQVEEIASTDPVRGPTTSKRAVKTTVVAKDQTTVVIGGLIQERTTRAQTKFPVLGSIPVLGWLFRNDSETKERTNLLLILTPYIIRDQSDFRAIFERKMKERQEFVSRFFGTNAQYQATVDYERKQGPLGMMVKTVTSAFKRVENGGPGTPDEHVIIGNPSAQQPAQGAPAQGGQPAQPTPETAPAPSGGTAAPPTGQQNEGTATPAPNGTATPEQQPPPPQDQQEPRESPRDQGGGP